MTLSNVKKLPVRNVVDQTEKKSVLSEISLPTILVTVIFIVAFYISFMWLIENFNRPIAVVKVEGTFHHLTQGIVETALAPYVETDFLTVDLEGIQQTVQKLPWVSNVTVRRIWPDGVAIKIKEEMAIARWGDKQLLDEEGRVFSANEITNDTNTLPILNGPDGYEQSVMKQYQHMGQLLRPLNRKITQLTLAERGAWELQLDDGMKIMLGRDRIMEKIQRFIRLYEMELAQSTTPILVVDVRYNNGIAVQWGTPPIDEQTTKSSTDVKS